MSDKPKLLTWVFSYGAEHTMYDPAWPTLTVRARSQEEARSRAEIKAVRLLNEHRAYWEWEDGEWKALPRIKGGVMGWSKGEIVESHWARKRREKARREYAAKHPFVWPKCFGGSAEALAKALSAPILQVIEEAPVIAEVFKTLPMPDGDSMPSIPIVRQAYTRAKPKGPPS